MADIYSIAAEKAAKCGVPLNIVLGVIEIESGGNPNAVSDAGAMGVMQLLPQTARALGVSDPFDPEQNIDGGVRYLREQFDRFGRWDLALAAYYTGPDTVEAYYGEHGTVPPWAQEYVDKVMSAAGSGSAMVFSLAGGSAGEVGADEGEDVSPEKPRRRQLTYPSPELPEAPQGRRRVRVSSESIFEMPSFPPATPGVPETQIAPVSSESVGKYALPGEPSGEARRTLIVAPGTVSGRARIGNTDIFSRARSLLHELGRRYSNNG